MLDAFTAKNINAWVGGILSPLSVVGTAFGYLPYIAALAAFVWYLIQIWESRTIQTWWTNKQLVRRSRRLAKLEAQRKIIVARVEALQRLGVAKETARDLVATATVEAAALKAKQEVEIAKKINTVIPLPE